MYTVQDKREHFVIEDADPMMLACAKMATRAVLLSVRPEVCGECRRHGTVVLAADHLVI
jgi:hypothetical protein